MHMNTKPTLSKSSEAIQVLTLLHQAGFESAVIAGGYIRDLYYEKDYKHIDIFVWDPDHSTERVPTQNNTKINRLLNWIGVLNLTDYDTIEEVFGTYQATAGKITRVFDIKKHHLPFQIILTRKPPVEFIKHHFNFGLCKCYCDGTKITYLPDFITDATNKTLTVVAEDMTEEEFDYCLLYTSPSPRDRQKSRMPSSA